MKEIDPRRARLIVRMAEKGINSPPTSSCGRLFDAISAIAGVRTVISYEAQAAMELENEGWEAGGLDVEAPPYGWDLIEGSDGYSIDMSETIRGAVRDVLEGKGKGWISLRFHRTVAEVILEVCRLIRRRFGLGRVILSGGVFQNRILLNLAVGLLERGGFEVFINRVVPPNDGGISLGQAYIAAFRVRG
ncbi:hypothetical protein DRP77_12850 [Candidatus Poribacteria bacterium]|nr:MAG: hypothetical protein DRP77_12850 [Candidatus Poribacteria bacterium]